MATETIEPFESEAVSKSRSESAEGMEGVELHRTHPSSGTGYQAIKRHSTTITDAVSDQAHFARTRGDESLITDGKRWQRGCLGEIKGGVTRHRNPS